MDFKFFSEENTTLNNQIIIQPYYQRFENDVEFCFQFDDEEPIMFATGPNECHITLAPTPDGYMTFTNNGRRFKLFARERQ